MAPVLAVHLVLSIIGGAPSNDESVVCLAADTLPICSGVLISPRTVLTAGHCIDTLGPSVSYFVHFGPDCRNPVKRVRVLEQRAHPAYTAEGKPFDAGLLRLAADAPVPALALSEVVVDAALLGRQVRHVGYGANQESPLSGWGFQRAVTHGLTAIDADFVWSGDMSANTCTGDSGGAVLLDGAVIALVSDGPDCHSPSADQRVDRVRAWVDATRAEFEPAPVPSPPPPVGCAQAPGAVLVASLFWRRRRS